ncbi:MAG: hypothetical protein HYS20_07320 [Rhodocyclales bacterium]|nr:hypothetical protein [Rhodocyclales bacterium]
MNDPQPTSPRRRLQELLAIPDSQRSDEEWDELNELEISLAPGNREGAPDPNIRRNPHNPPSGGGRGRSGGSGNPAGGGGGPGGGSPGGRKPFKRAPRKASKGNPNSGSGQNSGPSSGSGPNSGSGSGSGSGTA